MQARTLIEQTHAFSIRELVIATAWTTLIAIAARFIWVFPATYIPRWLSPRLRKRDPSPPWQWPFFLAFTGMRGVVSLAVALAIPFTVLDRPAVSPPRPDPVRHFRRHHHYADRPGLDVALCGALARAQSPGKKGAQGRNQGRAARPPGRVEAGRKTAGENHQGARPAGRGDRAFAHAQPKPHADTAHEPDRGARSHAPNRQRSRPS